jgi:hypothetical protein
MASSALKVMNKTAHFQDDEVSTSSILVGSQNLNHRAGANTLLMRAKIRPTALNQERGQARSQQQSIVIDPNIKSPRSPASGSQSNP